jgi:hypothetical protein
MYVSGSARGAPLIIPDDGPISFDFFCLGREIPVMLAPGLARP